MLGKIDLLRMKVLTMFRACPTRQNIQSMQEIPKIRIDRCMSQPSIVQMPEVDVNEVDQDVKEEQETQAEVQSARLPKG